MQLQAVDPPNNNVQEGKKSVRQQVEDLAKQRGLDTEFTFTEPPGFFFSYGSEQRLAFTVVLFAGV